MTRWFQALRPSVIPQVQDFGTFWRFPESREFIVNGSLFHSVLYCIGSSVGKSFDPWRGTVP